MTDLNPDIPDKPIEVSVSPIPDQAAAGGRDFLLLVAVLPALVAVLGTRDLKQIIDWFAGQEGLAFLGLLIAIVTPLWRQWLTRRKHADLKVLERNVDDTVAHLKGK